jgi:hypothetical protein
MQPFVECSGLRFSTEWVPPVDLRDALKTFWSTDSVCHRLFLGSWLEFFWKSLLSAVRSWVVNFCPHHVFEKIWNTSRHDPKTINGTLNLCIKIFVKHVSGLLGMLIPLRSSNPSSQQRVAWWKYGRLRSLWRLQLREINESNKTVSENDVAHESKSKLC